MFAQVGAGAEEEAFDGGEREFEDLTNFLVGHVFVSAKDDGHPLFFGQFLDRGVNGCDEFLLEGGIVRLDRVVVGSRHVIGFFVGVHGDLGLAVTFA